MIQIDALGDVCPIPVVKAKKAVQKLNGPGTVEILVDNEIAVQNLHKMADQMGCAFQSETMGPDRFRVTVTAGENDAVEGELPQATPGLQNTVVLISSARMGEGDDDLGKVLMKGFLYALGQQDKLPQSILFYNGGAALTCEESPALEDLQSMEARGVEILTCGTCLNHYGLSDRLKVGAVSNMYVIVEKMTQAGLIVKP